MGYEDFRFRAIHWAWLVLLTAGVLLNFSFDGPTTLANLGLVGFQLAVLTLYFSLKHRQFVFLPAQHLGWGDILFYFPLCLLFSPLNLILFTIASLCLTLLIWVACHVTFKQMPSTIPLAGCLSICLAAILIGSFQKGYDLRDDSILLGILKNRLDN